MSENCSGSCSSCSSDCESRKGPQILRNANNGKVKKVIAVVSGKGGVGKSLVTSMLAVKANKEGKKAAILDADITGPSIPKSFGLTERVTCNEDGTVSNAGLISKYAKSLSDWKNIVDIFTAKQIELVNEDHGICFDFQYEFGMLAYDAWLHRNDPIEDVFALRIYLDTGIKVFTVVNTHPALDQMLRWNADAMKKSYLERLESKEPQHYERVCKEIAAMIAAYCVGEDYTFFLDNDFQKLPKRLRDACMSDAKKLVDGLITSGT